jgi:hypothetical protein
VRQDASDDLESHEPDDQQERDGEVPTVRVRAHGVGVASGTMVVTGVIVTRLASIGMPMRIVILGHGCLLSVERAGEVKSGRARGRRGSHVTAM